MNLYPTRKTQKLKEIKIKKIPDLITSSCKYQLLIPTEEYKTGPNDPNEQNHAILVSELLGLGFKEIHTNATASRHPIVLNITRMRSILMRLANIID